MLRLGLLAAVVFCAAIRTAAAGNEPVFPAPVHETTLDNGFKVVVIPHDSPGIVAYFTIVRTGSRDEVDPGRSGFAHFFEHMMFRGTERYSPEEYNEVLRRMGAESNAFTTDDYTAYHIVGPARELETMMDIESDRFQNLQYTEEAFRTEALAVLGEYNLNVANPLLPMLERLRGLAFSRHTYGHTTIGLLEDIRAMPEQYEYSLQFFDEHYRPENAILLVAGDVEPAGVFELAKQYYGDWERGYRPPRIPMEPPQEAPKSAHIQWPNPTRPYLMLGYRTPPFTTETVDFVTLDIISQLLFSESAPLYQQIIVVEQWADQLSGSAADRRDPYLFTITARIASNELVPRVREAIDSGIAALQEQPVDLGRLDRVKSHLRYRFALRLDSPADIAFSVAHYLNLTGDVGTLNRVYELYDRVTPEDVQRMARQVFVPEGETMVTLAHAADVRPAGVEH